MKPFKPEHYFRAALERMRQAQGLYLQDASYALAMYVAGVAVECLLRAFKGKHDPTFDEKHDLQRLFSASGILHVSPAARPAFSAEQAETYQRQLRAAVNEIWILWTNDLRYASEDRLRSHLKKNLHLRVGVRGDILKASARRLLAAAQTFIDRGFLLWNS